MKSSHFSGIVVISGFIDCCKVNPHKSFASSSTLMNKSVLLTNRKPSPSVDHWGNKEPESPKWRKLLQLISCTELCSAGYKLFSYQPSLLGELLGLSALSSNTCCICNHTHITAPRWKMDVSKKNICSCCCCCSLRHTHTHTYIYIYDPVSSWWLVSCHGDGCLHMI